MAEQSRQQQPNNGRADTATSRLNRSWAQKVTEEYRQLLSTKRMNELTRRSSSRRSTASGSHVSSRSSTPQPLSRHSSRSHPLHLQNQQHLYTPRHGSGDRIAHSIPSLDDFTYGAPPPPSSLRNLPLIPAAPVDTLHRKFRSQMFMLSDTPCKWENPGLLDDAMKDIPLQKIFQEAGDEQALLQAQADSIGKKPAWAWQDCVIRALLKWFKREFFTWVNNPACSRCGSPTIAEGTAAPIPDEKALGGNRVELYKCAACGSYERFPRYNDAFVLLKTRRGRCGEWANCFAMLCRAMGSRVRWVWNSEDHVWTEVYSEYRGRWVHVDPCEEAFDKPLLYTEGWKKKLGYCIAFSADGATDVTLRYCRNPMKNGVERTKVPEEVLLHIIDEIRHARRRNREKEEKFRLEGEDMKESRELRHYYISTLMSEVVKLSPVSEAGASSTIANPNTDHTATLTTTALDPDAQKALEGRQSGDPQWSAARGEDGQTGPQDQQRRPE